MRRKIHFYCQGFYLALTVFILLVNSAILVEAQSSEGAKMALVSRSVMSIIKPNGCVALQIPFGNLGFADKDIPIFCRFDSDKADYQQPEMPRDWSIPILHSVAYLESEDVAVFKLPDGRTLRLKKSGEDFSSSHYECAVNEHSNRIILKDKSCAYTFQDGRLISLQRILNGKSEAKLVWSYTKDGLCERISAEQNQPLMEIKRSGKDMERSMALIVYKNGRADEHLLCFSKINEEISETLPFDLRCQGDAMTSIAPAGVDKLLVEIGRSDEVSGTEFLTISSGQSKGILSKLAWKNTSGWAEEINGNKVLTNVSRTGDEIKFATPQVVIFNGEKDGKVIQNETTLSNNGVTSTSLPNGTLVQKFVAPVPDGGMVNRKEVSTSASGAKTSVYTARFDSKGQIIRDQRGEFTREFTNGVYRVYKNGVLVREY